MLRRAAAVALALAGLAAVPSTAMAQSQLFQDYRRDGVVNPCAYSPGQLRQGLQNLPPDVEQYVPGLSDQLRRSCPAAPAPALAGQQTVTQVTPSGQIIQVPAKPRVVIPRPPAPNAPAARQLAGVAPAVAQESVPDIPGWLAAILAAVLMGSFGLAVAVRYGVLELSAAGIRGSAIAAGERVSDFFAGLWDRIRFR